MSRSPGILSCPTRTVAQGPDTAQSQPGSLHTGQAPLLNSKEFSAQSPACSQSPEHSWDLEHTPPPAPKHTPYHHPCMPFSRVWDSRSLKRIGGAWVWVEVHSTAIAWCRPLPRLPPPPVPTLTPHTCLPHSISATHLLAESLTPTFALRVCHTPKKQKQFLGQTGGLEGWSFHA